MHLIRILFFIFLLKTSLVFADAASELAAYITPIHGLSAKFNQQILDNRGRVVQKAVGRMALLRPGKFRWEVLVPIPQLIIANGTKVWVYDRDLQQVTIKAFNQSRDDSPALLLAHNNQQLLNKFNVKIVSIGDGVTWFRLKPKKADSMFASVELGFKDKKMIEMKLADHIGHVTIIKFSQLKNNPLLNNHLFIFTPPANVDVIDETKQSKQRR